MTQEQLETVRYYATTYKRIGMHVPADAIAAVLARLEACEAALKPFAEFGRYLNGSSDMAMVGTSDYIRAAEVLR